MKGQNNLWGHNINIKLCCKWITFSNRSKFCFQFPLRLPLLISAVGSVPAAHPMDGGLAANRGNPPHFRTWAF